MAKAAFTARSPRAATGVDAELGARIRARRGELKISQEHLAAAIGVTFQQVQKYEKGLNRIAASTLVDICEALEITPAALLPGISTTPSPSLLQCAELAELARVFTSLNDQGRATLLNVARALYADRGERAPAKRRAKS